MARTTTNSKTIKASANTIYQAFTNPSALEVWQVPGNMTAKVHNFDLKVGGGYEMSLFYPESEKKMQGKTQGKEDRFTARFVELIPNRKIVQVVNFQSPLGSNYNQVIMKTKKSNKEIITEIFTELSKGNDELFLDTMSEDMQWNWMGSGQWSKSFVGKSEVLNDLWKNVRATIKQPYKVIVHRIIADGDNMVVEMTGQNETTTNRPYKNNYCWICRLKSGKLCEINEYMDTELVTKAFSK